MSGLSLIDRLLIVLAVFQLAAFALFWLDKTQAQNGDWRVRERTLLLITLLGGFGAWLAQHLLRHKTRKEPFRTLLGVAISLHLVAVGVGIWWVLKG